MANLQNSAVVAKPSRVMLVEIINFVGQTLIQSPMTAHIDPLALIHKYYAHAPELEQLLITHCQQVTQRALSVAEARPELGIDTQFVYEAGMLHDIGIFLTNAPGILCHGAEPYIRHGILGAQLMRREGLERHARVCERHTGTGLSIAQIEARQLPLPTDRTLEPQTLEEQLICWADKFYSKSHLGQQKPYEVVVQKMARYGTDGVARFERWTALFEPR